MSRTIPTREISSVPLTFRTDWPSIDRAVEQLASDAWARREEPGELERAEAIRALATKQREDDLNRTAAGNPKAIRPTRHDVAEYPANPQYGLLFAEDREDGGLRRTSEPQGHDWEEGFSAAQANDRIRPNRDPEDLPHYGWQLHPPRTHQQLALEAGMAPILEQLPADWRSILLSYYEDTTSDATIGERTGITSQAVGKKRRKALGELQRLILAAYPEATSDELEPEPKPDPWKATWDAQLTEVEEPAWLHEERVPVPRRPVEHLRLADPPAPAA